MDFSDLKRQAAMAVVGAMSFPKQPVQGGVGGNPWISVRFADSAGQPIGSETLLGRCVQLLPGN